MSDTMFDAMFGAAIAGGSGGGFTPTETQLEAMNSGIDSTKVAQIETNKNNISLKQDVIDSSHKLNADLIDDSSTTNKFATAAQLSQIETNKNNIAMFHKAANTDIYFSESEPAGTITEGSYWIGTSGTKISSKSANIATGLTWESGTIFRSGADSDAQDNAIRTVGYINCSPNTEYTFNANTTIELTAARISFYDSNNQGLDRTSVFNNPTFTTPNNCVKIRISVEAENIGIEPVTQLTPIITYMLWT